MISSIYTLIVYLMLAMSSPAHAMSKSGSEGPFAHEAIGVRTLHYQDPARDRPVLVEFWYPTDETEYSLESTDDSVWIHPKEARNVAISSKRASYPLILMSHGHRGDRRERTWLADGLVRQGYIVASVEHHGNAWYQYNPLSGFCFWDRAKDVSFTITSLLNDTDLQKHIDAERIGFVGYSMGGMTGLALAGAEAKYAKEIARAQQNLAGEVSQEAFNKLDFSEAEKSYREPRIRSILLICPATFAYLPETLKKIKTPIGLIVSLDDEVLPHKEHAHKIIKNVIPRKLKIMRNKTSHYAFLNKMSEKGCQILQKSTSNPASLNWTPIHKEATAFAIKFFQETLPPKTENQ